MGKHLSVFVKELNSEYQVPPIELFDSDLSPLRESFEECAIQLHHYTPQDEIDKGMLNFEFERLRKIMRIIIQKAIEEFIDLWDKCLVP
ncbi:hypothetical protein Glove_184g39 [Diversispora epigaea]|uniref:Uncharacterized protein n=1 Tax=Diversispora epigaea TaxID=1348612 RepID=A0A397IMR9_9GLOM|nr:hypothetical protein Glove_184g39 [Diversispora epigaea]